MHIQFNIHYPTRFGESIRIEFSDGEFKDAIYHAGDVWKATHDGQVDTEKVKIFLLNSRAEKVLLKEYSFSTGEDVFLMLQPPHQVQSVYSTRPFSILDENPGNGKRTIKKRKVTFMLNCDLPGRRLVPCITGSADILGKWKEKRALPMKRSGDHWICRLDIRSLESDFEFKFGLFDTRKKMLVEYEEGGNRLVEAIQNTSLIEGTATFRSRWRGAGLNIPVSSLRTSSTWGVGDFTALMEFVDVASRCGFSMIQLLPVNDTISSLTDKDSYPYSAISAFALHPIYLDVQKLAKALDIRFGENTFIRINELNATPALNYSGVVELKMSALKVIYEKDQDSFRDDYNWFEFFDINRDWLVPYAAFCYLRDKYGTADNSQWREYSVYDEDRIQELASPGSDAYPDLSFYYYLQYHLHLQLRDAVDHAHRQKVILKGDLPIGVARFSADTWTNPGLFFLDTRAGAPPDYFTQDGQDWGFPTYNWDAMKVDGYAWWKKRLGHMENYFDALRIDHVIGLMRIWTIPGNASTAALGYFVPAVALSRADFEMADPSIDPDRYTGAENDSNVILVNDEHPGHYHFRFNMQSVEMFRSLPPAQQESLQRLYSYYFGNMQQQLWRDRGQEHLSMLRNATTMLLCAEDLGFVPPVTESLLDSLQILSLWVHRMPRHADQSFANLAEAPYLSVVTPSTHDMTTLSEWWEGEQGSIQHFYESVLGMEGIAPGQITPEVATRIISLHLESPAMWSVFLLQDILTCSAAHAYPELSHRINDPGNNEHVWDYRYPVTCEELAGDETFTRKIRKLIRNSGR